MENNLTLFNGNKQMYTSREISEWTGKQHYHVLRDIESEIKNLINGEMEEYAETNFGLGYYNDKNNQSRPMYNLTKIGVQQLAMRYDAIVRAKVNMKQQKETQV